jgi:hypothetical protein
VVDHHLRDWTTSTLWWHVHHSSIPSSADSRRAKQLPRFSAESIKRTSRDFFAPIIEGLLKDPVALTQESQAAPLITMCFDYLGTYSVSNAEYPCAQRFFFFFWVACFVILWGKFSFFKPATNSVCAWRLL